MKHIIYLLMIIGFIFSCTNDDDSQIQKEKEPIELKTLPVTNESLYSLELNAEFKIDDVNLMTEYGFIIDTLKNVSTNNYTWKFDAYIVGNKLVTRLENLINNKTLFIKSYVKINGIYYYGNEIEHKLINDNVLYITEDLVIDTQEKLDELSSKKYTSIRQKNKSCSLIITGSVKDISKLNSIEILKVFYLKIEKTQIENLNGFNKLKLINGGENRLYYGVEIHENDKLKKIEGFEELVKNEGTISIYKNPNLESITSFNKLHLNENKLLIVDNSKLKNVNSFNSLWATSEINIIKNENLLSLNNSFENLELAVNGVAITNNNRIESIISFKALKKTDNISVENNTLLKEISFISLEETDFFLNVKFNDNLVKLNFPKYKKTEYINIQSNNILKSLEGIPNLETDYLEIISNNSLVSMTSFSNVNISIKIEDNPKLESLKGLENIKTLKGTFDNASLLISYNNSLEDLSGLDNLEGVYGASVTISANQNLKSLKGLNNLASIKHPYGNSRSLTISENPKLSEYCAIKKFVSNKENNLYTINNLYNPKVEDIIKDCN